MNVDERRRARGWSIAELARRAQVSRTQADAACNGSARPDVMSKVTAALDTEEAPIDVAIVDPADSSHHHPTLRDASLHVLGEPHEHGAMRVERRGN